MSYVVTTDGALGSAGQIATGAVGAAANVATGLINLIYGSRAREAQQEELAAGREGAFSSWQSDREMAALLAQQDAEVRRAQDAILSEQEAEAEARAREIRGESANLRAQIDRDRRNAERRALEAHAMRWRMPTWGWWALGGVAVASVVGVSAFVATRVEES